MTNQGAVIVDQEDSIDDSVIVYTVNSGAMGNLFQTGFEFARDCCKSGLFSIQHLRLQVVKSQIQALKQKRINHYNTGIRCFIEEASNDSEFEAKAM